MAAAKWQELIGKQFGTYVVMEKLPAGKYSNTYMLCKCECGRSFPIDAHQLMREDRKYPTAHIGCMLKSFRFTHALVTRLGRGPITNLSRFLYSRGAKVHEVRGVLEFTRHCEWIIREKKGKYITARLSPEARGINTSSLLENGIPTYKLPSLKIYNYDVDHKAVVYDALSALLDKSSEVLGFKPNLIGLGGPQALDFISVKSKFEHSLIVEDEKSIHQQQLISTLAHPSIKCVKGDWNSVLNEVRNTYQVAFQDSCSMLKANTEWLDTFLRGDKFPRFMLVEIVSWRTEIVYESTMALNFQKLAQTHGYKLTCYDSFHYKGKENKATMVVGSFGFIPGENPGRFRGQ